MKKLSFIVLCILLTINNLQAQTKITFFDDWVTSVPESGRKTQILLVITQPTNAFFAPPPSLRPRHVVRRELPSVTALAVIFAHRSPLSVGKVSSPFVVCHLLSIEYKVWSIEYKVWSIEYKVWSIEYKVWSIEYKVWSIEYKVRSKKLCA